MKKNEKELLGFLSSYQKEIDRSETLTAKLAILNTVNQNMVIRESERFRFFNNNCQKLAALITDYDQAIDLFVFFNLCGCQKIWSMVVALKAIKIWLKNKDVEEISLSYRNVLIRIFSPTLTLQTIELIVAKEIEHKLSTQL